MAEPPQGMYCDDGDRVGGGGIGGGLVDRGGDDGDRVGGGGISGGLVDRGGDVGDRAWF